MTLTIGIACRIWCEGGTKLFSVTVTEEGISEIALPVVVRYTNGKSYVGNQSVV